MKVGDIIEWKGLNRILRGEIISVSSEMGQFLCRLDNGKTFPPDDLLSAKTARIIEA